jgi:hypothetical protein
MSVMLMAFVCTWAWDAFINGKVYYCTDGGSLDFLFGVGDWVHNAESVAQVAPRAMSEPDEIKTGWSISGLWCLWGGFVVVSVVISAVFAWMPWRAGSANKPAAGQRRSSVSARFDCDRPGVPERER